jgi:thymidylate synthase
MNTLDKKYQDLLEEIIDNGVEKIDRTGTGTISIFGKQIRHRMSQGFPLLTTKKMAWKTMVVELLWFLRGDTNIKYLIENNCHIWDGDYNKSGRTDGELGPIYGKQWRDWNGEIQTELSSVKGEDGFYSYISKHVPGIDQVANLINDLKTNPDSRRLMVNAWNVGELDKMTLPPCHYGFQVYTRELSKGERMDYWFKNHKPNRDVCDSVDESSEQEQHKYFDGANVPKRAISLMWNQRSVDTFLGLPFNIASYGLLLEIIAKEVNMIPEELIGNLGDVHLYKNHIEQAKQQIKRDPYELPKLWINDLRSNTNTIIGDITKWTPDDFKVENYQSHPSIKAPLSN